MRIYEMYDEDQGRTVGTLLYYDRGRVFICELEDDLDEWSAPFHFAGFVKKGIFTIPRDESLRWVRARIIPPSRQNIDLILKTHKLKKYDERIFLELSRGRCSQDEITVRAIEALPDYVLRRQQKNLTGCIVLTGHSIMCIFVDGTVRKIDLESMSAHDENARDLEKVLHNDELFASCKLGNGGYFITFNDSIDIPAYTLHEEGTLLPLSTDDLRMMARNGLVDTTSAGEMLGCTRQNLSYMTGKGSLTPIVTDVKGSLFIKDDILRAKW